MDGYTQEAAAGAERQSSPPAWTSLSPRTHSVAPRPGQVQAGPSPPVGTLPHSHLWKTDHGLGERVAWVSTSCSRHDTHSVWHEFWAWLRKE